MTRAATQSTRAIALFALSALSVHAHAQPQPAGAKTSAQPEQHAASSALPSSHGLRPRLFSTVRLGPVGRTTVRIGSRQLAGAPAPAPGLGARLDLPVHENLLVGLEVGVLFEAAHPLRPYDFARSESPSVSGLIADLVFSVRRVWSLDRERLELYVSTGVGVSGRPAISADLPLEDQNGATQPGNFNDAPGWGVLVQAGVGSTFWLSRDFAAFVELLGVARQTHAVINEATRGDFLLQINDTQALLVFGFGTAVGGS